MREYNEQFTIGWDVGGAHLKAALFGPNGQLLQVMQVPCALWQGLHLLEAAAMQVLQAFAPKTKQAAFTHGVTMTGELVDLFSNRQAGVSEISRVMTEQLTGEVYFYKANTQANGEFISLAELAIQWSAVASVNWHASAVLVAQGLKQKHEYGLLVDMGSTTTDLIPLVGGKPYSKGLTDAARMQHDELVYTGMVRTPLMAVAQTIMLPVNLQQDSVTVAGQVTQVAAEYFATMADVYRLTGDLKPDDDMGDTADGQDKSNDASARRIARMIGYDVAQAKMQDWVALANAFKTQQLQHISRAMTKHLQRLVALESHINTIAIIGAGIGAPLIQQMTLTLPAMQNKTIVYHKLEDITPIAKLFASNQQLAQQASDYLPAVAVAYFMQQQINKSL